jgi:hypothetical protein
MPGPGSNPPVPIPGPARIRPSDEERRAARQRSALGCRLLKSGRFDLGWAEYEARHVESGLDWEALGERLWRGQPLHGCTLLVHREQGLGDEIWLASCYRELIESARHCSFTCDPRLRALYERSFPTATILCGEPAASPDPDYVVPAGNACRYLRDDLRRFPSRPGYLVADPARRAAWRARLDALGRGPKVGISWQGGADLSQLRQAPWELWRELLGVRGIAWISLQYAQPRLALDRLRAAWGVDIHELPELDPLDDIDGLAALMSELELVIQVPNTNVHVAGAVGARQWILFRREWGCFWILRDREVPWYPGSEVLLRDEAAGWETCVARARAELEQLAGG